MPAHTASFLILIFGMLRFLLNNGAIDSEKGTGVLFFFNTQLDPKEIRPYYHNYAREPGTTDRDPT